MVGSGFFDRAKRITCICLGLGQKHREGGCLGSGLVLNDEFGCGENWLGYGGDGGFVYGLLMCVLGWRLPDLLSPI